MRLGLVVLVLVAGLILGACGDDGDGGIGPSGPTGIDIDDDDDRVAGSGEITTETREVEGFDRISLTGEGTVRVTHGDTESLTVTTDGNLLELIDTVVVGTTLEIRAPDDVDIDPTSSVVYEIVVIELAGIALSGAGSFEVDRFSVDDASIEVSGAGDVDVGAFAGSSLTVAHSGVGRITVTGAVDDQQVTLSGVGEYAAADLESRRATLDVGGTSNATIWVTDTLDATVSGIGELAYYGQPEVTSDVRDDGTLTSLGPRAPTTTPTLPEPECDDAAVYAAIDEALVAARLTPGGEWTTETAGNPFDERTHPGEEFAARLALDCSVKATHSTDDGADRLLLAAWTGPRLAFVVQATDGPSTPYAPEALVTILTEEARGEFLVDDQSRWAASFSGGETILLGHDDYNLGATAKAWQTSVPRFPEEEPTLESERYAMAVLEEAGHRNVAIAQPAEFGSEEGTVMFVSPTGQITVAYVAPLGWFDPARPRFLSGESTSETVDGIEVRVTLPTSEERDRIGFNPRSGEVGWTCVDHVWLIEPATNGGIDEQLESARAVIATPACQTSSE